MVEESALKKETIKRDLSKDMSAMREGGVTVDSIDSDLASRVDHSKLDISTPLVDLNKKPPTSHRPPVPEFDSFPVETNADGGQESMSMGIASSVPTPVQQVLKPKTSSGDQGKVVKELEREIERLNSECLELEEQVGSLKVEGQEAWTSYQRSQEKAAALEAELQEEIDEAGRFLEAATEEALAVLFDRLDADHDGTVSLREALDALSTRILAAGTVDSKARLRV